MTRKLEESVKRNNRILVMLIVTVIVLGIISYFAYQAANKPMDFYSVHQRVLDGEVTQNGYMYNGFAFVREKPGSLWRTIAFRNGTQFEINFYFAPKELQDIAIPNDSYKKIIDSKKVILVLDNSLNADVKGPGAGAVAQIEVGKMIVNKFGILNIQTMTAVSPDTANSAGVPTASCANASKTTTVIQFALSNQTQITQDKTCIMVYGSTTNELIRAATRLSFQLVGIMR
jgi:hypothetical protein